MELRLVLDAIHARIVENHSKTSVLSVIRAYNPKDKADLERKRNAAPELTWLNELAATMTGKHAILEAGGMSMGNR